jgi:2'-5' RNA ligase
MIYIYSYKFMENYRTFIGVPIKVGPAFLNARNELIRHLEGERISWVAPERFHVTLKFIGDTEKDMVKPIGISLKDHLAIPGRTNVHMGALDSFGPRKKPRVVWVGFEETGIFDSLKNGVDMALSDCGIPPSDQPFRAHLTLGRIRSLKDIGNFYHAIEKMRKQFSGEVILDKVVFYHSKVGDGAPIYTPLKTIEFPA